MLIAIVMMGGLGVIVGIGLAIASKVFYVYVDPKVMAVDDVLPGANCGGCGYPGCSSNAEAVVAGKSAPNSCVAAGPETAEAIAAILGVTVEAKEPDIALPGCTYGVNEADTKFLYHGLKDCRAAALLSGGMKVCSIGCLGLGSCAKACPFDAIVMGNDGLPKVSEQRCTGCGTCERICPKNIITLSSVTRRILKEYTTEDCTTPCQRACPAGIDICAYIREIEKGNYLRAVQIIKERNPFAAVIGRICPRPCENECRRQYVDEPVAINYLKRYAADYERCQSERIQPYKAPETGRRVAVIGGGIQGLAAAFFTARLGHAVTIYEAGEQLGGLLRAAIARYRLPTDILDWDINGVLDMGVTAETGKTIGQDLSIANLLTQGYNAILLATGGWDSRLMRTGGQDEHSPVPGCHLLIDVIKSDHKGYTKVRLGDHVIVISHGDLTLDAISACKEQGAEKITVLMRNTDTPAIDLPDVEVLSNTGISRLYGNGDQLMAVDLIDTDSQEIQRIDVRHVIIASGRIPELIFTPPAVETKTQENENITTTPTGQWEAFVPYKQPPFHRQIGLLAKGDVLSDFQAAIKAIAAGRRAAASIHKSLYSIALDLTENVLSPQTPIQNVNKVMNVPARARQIMPLAPSDQTDKGIELEKGFSPKAAQIEAKRCLQCGLICYKREIDATSPAAIKH